MRITTSTTDGSKPNDYRLRISARESYAWSVRPGAAWPCSSLANKTIYVEVDSNGLAGYAIDNKQEPHIDDVTELEAIISDHLPAKFKHLWPCYSFA